MNQVNLDNFNPGPAALPPEVISATRAALTSVEGGPGILELSHRSAAFDRVIDAARDRITQLYQLPDTHEVIFLQGGASLQFAMIPMNLGTHAGYLNTGEWSRRALAEARLLAQGETREPLELWSSAESGFRSTPQVPILLPDLPHDPLRYVHLTSNNTIYGTQYHDLPILTGAQESHPPLVIDASSDIFSQVIDWSRVGLLYAGAQKNAGASGVTLVIARRDWLYGAPALASCPKIMRYRTHAEKGSLYHTPNTLGIFVVGEVARWVSERGGIEAMQRRAQRRARSLYEVIDAHSESFEGHAEVSARSHMNVTFRGATPEIEARLLERAERAQMIGLKGHRSVGGLRASLYNAVSDESVERLVSLVDEVGQASRAGA